MILTKSPGICICVIYTSIVLFAFVFFLRQQTRQNLSILTTNRETTFAFSLMVLVAGLHSAWDPANISTFQYLTRISKSQDLNFSIKYLNFSKSRISTQYLTHSQYLKPVSHGKGSISQVSVSHAQYLKVYSRNANSSQFKSVMVRHTYVFN